MPRAAVHLLVLALVAPALSTAAADALDDDHRLPFHMCGNQGQYAPNSSYEANLRYLAAALPAMLHESFSLYIDVLAGERPDQIAASALCNSSSSDYCAACLARAFRYAHRMCPYSRRAMADLRACRVSYRREQDVGVISTVGFFSESASNRWLDIILVGDIPVMLAFQVVGLACVLFMFLQEWRASRKDPASANLLP